MSDDLSIARAEATQQVAAAVLKAAGGAMELHGSDPQGGVIVAAGFAGAIRAMGDIDPAIPRTIFLMLARELARLPSQN